MKNLLLLSLITFLSLSSTVLAQEKISEFNVHYGTEFFSGKTSYQVINEKTNETVIFIEDYKKTHAYLLDSTFKVKSYLAINDIKSTYKELKGHIVDGDNYKIFLSNTKSTKYHILNFNFKKKIHII